MFNYQNIKEMIRMLGTVGGILIILGGTMKAIGDITSNK